MLLELEDLLLEIACLLEDVFDGFSVHDSS